MSADLNIILSGQPIPVFLGENTVEAARQAALAVAAAAAAAISADVALASANYYPTIAAGVAATAVGAGFSSAEGGNLALYERTAGAPFYLLIEVIAVGELTVATSAAIGTTTAQASIKAIRTLGYAALGDGGGGLYVDDALSDAALAAAHPRACFVTANGRYFRLLPDAGAVTVERFGALGDPARTYAVNDQPAIQAAITYANTVGIGVVAFGRAEYTVWSKVRTSDPFSYAPDGNALVVTEFVELRGLPQKTRLNYRGPAGQTFQGTTAGTNFQVVLGKVWRGHGIFVVGKAVDPGLGKRPGLRVVNMSLQGGTLGDGDGTWPVPIGTGSGWDITHKGIFIEPDKFTGETYIYRSEIIGFRGEIIYSSNNQQSGALFMDDVLLGESNGQAINPAGGFVHCVNIRSYNTLACIEGWGGAYGYIEGYFSNVMGNASSIQGGVYNTSGSGSYYKPQIPTVGPFATRPPVLLLNIVIESAQKSVAIGSFLYGKITAIDTVLAVSANETSGTFKEGVQDTDLEIVSIVDKANIDSALSITGGTAAGSKLVNRCRYKVRTERTKRAAAAGYIHSWGVQINSGFSYGPEVVIEGGSGQVKIGGVSMSGGSTAFQDNVPVCRNNNWTRTTYDSNAIGHNVTTAATIVIKGDYMVIFGTGGTLVDAILPTAGIGDGHQLTLQNISGATFFFTLGVAGGSGLQGPRRVIAGTAGRDMIKLVFEAKSGGWREVENLCKPLNGAATIDVPSIAAGAVSAVQTITVTGARAGMMARVTTFSDIGDNFGIIDVRCVTDAVKFRVANRDAGAAQDPASADYRAEVQYGH